MTRKAVALTAAAALTGAVVSWAVVTQTGTGSGHSGAVRPPATPYGCGQVMRQLTTFGTALTSASDAGDTISGVTLLGGMVSELRADAADPKAGQPLTDQELALAAGLQKMTGTSYQEPLDAIKRTCQP